MVDLTTLRTISKIDTGESPDAIVYDPRHREIYVFNHRGNSVTVIDAKSPTVTRPFNSTEIREFAVGKRK